MAKSFKKLVDKTGNEKTKKIAKKRTKELLKQSKSECFVINDDALPLVMYLYDAGDKRKKYIRLDFNDYANCDDFLMVLDRPTLKGMADFINQYLENN